MNKPQPKPARQHSTGFIVTTWVGAVLSLGLLLLVAMAVRSDLGALKPCSANNSGLSVTNCGKTGLNTGDLLLLALFVLSACLVVTLFTAAWQMTRRKSK